MRPEEKDVMSRLLAACSGHPHAKIPWPHRLLHDAVREIKDLRAKLTAALEAQRKAERERDEAESLLASATDLLNTCARENYAVQADRPTGIKFVINNIWAALSGFRTERDAARAQLQHITDAAREAISSTPGAERLGPYEDSTGAFNALKAWHGFSEWLKTELEAARAEADRFTRVLEDRESFIANYQHATELERQDHEAEADRLRNDLIATKAALSTMEARWLENLALKAPEVSEALKTSADLTIQRDDLWMRLIKMGHTVSYGKDGHLAVDGKTLPEVVEAENQATSA